MTCNDEKSSSLVINESIVETRRINDLITEEGASINFEFSKPFKSMHTDDRGGGGGGDGRLSSKNDLICKQLVYEFATPIEIKTTKKSFNEINNYSTTITTQSSSPLKNYFNNNNNSNLLSKAIATTTSSLLTSTSLSTSMDTSTSTSQTVQPPPQHQRNHVVVVEQAPFSVFKSFKAQESNDKASNNVTVINSLRNHPYDNAIRTSFTNENRHSNMSSSNQSTNDLSKTSTNISSISTSLLTNSQQQNKTKNSLTASSSVTCNLNRNSSSNAILAQLKSISPNFKSIFVRPKHSKHIDSSSLINKTKLHHRNLALINDAQFLNAGVNTHTSKSSMKSILNSLYNNSANTTQISTSKTNIGAMSLSSPSLFNLISNRSLSRGLINKQQMSSTIKDNRFLAESSRLINILPHTEAKELRLNASVDELLNEFTNENQIITNIDTKNKSLTLQQEKWTCMVCLSKHLEKVDICSICGSSKPPSPPIKHAPMSLLTSSSKNHFGYPSCTSPAPSTSSSTSVSPSSQIFTNYLINELGLKHKLATSMHQSTINSSQQLKINTTPSIISGSSILQTSPKTLNPYLKKWTCIQCNYSNDSLKIVCLNCRWIKTSTTSVSSSITSPQSFSTTAVSSLNNTTSSLSADESSSASASPVSTTLPTKENLVNRDEGTPTKLAKPSDSNNNNISNVCASCKSPLHEKTDTSTTTIKPKDTLLTPLFNLEKKPVEAEHKKIEELPKLTFFANQEKEKESGTKWNCPSCLVSNADTSQKCVCCATQKPTLSTSTTTTPTTSSTIASSFPLSTQTKSSFFNGAAESKWACSTCLVNNDADKLKCVCCQTSKPLSALSKPSEVTKKWTCSTCLVSNDADKSKCACCQTDKPSTDSTIKKLSSQSTLILPENLSSTSPASLPSIKFGTSTPSESIKFGTSTLSESIKFGTSTPSESIKFGTSTPSESIKFGSISSNLFGKPSETSTSGPIAFGTSQFKLPSLKTTETSQPEKLEANKVLEKTETSTSSMTPSIQLNFKPLVSSDDTLKSSFADSTSKAITQQSQSPFSFGIKPATSTVDAKLTFSKPEETSKIESSSKPIFSFGQTQSTSSTTLPVKASTEPFSLFKATLGSTSTSQGDTKKFSFAPSTSSTPPPSAPSTLESSKGFGQINIPTATLFQTSTKPVQSETMQTPSTTTSSPLFFPSLQNQDSQSKPISLFGTTTNTNTTNTPMQPSTGIFGTSQQQTQTKPQLYDSTSIHYPPNTSLPFGSNSSQPALSLFGTTTSTQPSTNLLSTSSSTPSFPQFSFGTKPSESTAPSQALTTPSFLLSNQQTPSSQTSNNTFMQTPFNFGTSTNNVSFGLSNVTYNKLGQPISGVDGQPSNKLFNNNMNQAQLPTPSFNFNPNANPNFNFSTSNSTQNGIIQFSGGTDPFSTSASGPTERKFRKATRRNR